MTTAKDLFGANTLYNHKQSARALAACVGETWGDYPVRSLDWIATLIARDGWEWGLTPSTGVDGGLLGRPVVTLYAEVWHSFQVPNQHPRTIAHALRCLWLEEKGEKA